MAKYKMVQIPEDAHKVLKEYCEKHNKKMGMEVADIRGRERCVITQSTEKK